MKHVSTDAVDGKCAGVASVGVRGSDRAARHIGASPRHIGATPHHTGASTLHHGSTSRHSGSFTRAPSAPHEAPSSRTRTRLPPGLHPASESSTGTHQVHPVRERGLHRDQTQVTQRRFAVERKTTEILREHELR